MNSKRKTKNLSLFLALCLMLGGISSTALADDGLSPSEIYLAQPERFVDLAVFDFDSDFLDDGWSYSANSRAFLIQNDVSVVGVASDVSQPLFFDMKNDANITWVADVQGVVSNHSDALISVRSIEDSVSNFVMNSGSIVNVRHEREENGGIIKALESTSGDIGRPPDINIGGDALIRAEGLGSVAIWVGWTGNVIISGGLVMTTDYGRAVIEGGNITIKETGTIFGHGEGIPFNFILLGREINIQDDAVLIRWERPLGKTSPFYYMSGSSEDLLSGYAEKSVWGRKNDNSGVFL